MGVPTALDGFQPLEIETALEEPNKTAPEFQAKDSLGYSGSDTSSFAPESPSEAPLLEPKAPLQAKILDALGAALKDHAILAEQHTVLEQEKSKAETTADSYQAAFDAYNKLGRLKKIATRFNAKFRKDNLGVSDIDNKKWQDWVKTKRSETKREHFWQTNPIGHGAFLKHEKDKAGEEVTTVSKQMTVLAQGRIAAQTEVGALDALKRIKLQEADLAPLKEITAETLRTRQTGLQSKMEETRSVLGMPAVSGATKTLAKEVLTELTEAMAEVHSAKAMFSLAEDVKSLDPVDDNFENNFTLLEKRSSKMYLKGFAETDGETLATGSKTNEIKPVSGLKAAWEASSGGTGAFFKEGAFSKNVEDRLKIDEALKTKQAARKVVLKNREAVTEYYKKQYAELENNYRPWANDQGMLDVLSRGGGILNNAITTYVDKAGRGLFQAGWEKDDSGVAASIRAKMAELRKNLEKEKGSAQKRVFDKVYASDFQARFAQIEASPRITFQEFDAALARLSSNPAISDADKAAIIAKVASYKAAAKMFAMIQEKNITEEETSRADSESLELLGRMLANSNLSNVNFRTEDLLKKLGLQPQSIGNVKTVAKANMGDRQYQSAQDVEILQAPIPMKAWDISQSQAVLVKSFLAARKSGLSDLRQQVDPKQPELNEIRQRLQSEAESDLEQFSNVSKFPMSTQELRTAYEQTKYKATLEKLKGILNDLENSAGYSEKQKQLQTVFDENAAGIKSDDPELILLKKRLQTIQGDNREFDKKVEERAKMIAEGQMAIGFPLDATQVDLQRILIAKKTAQLVAGNINFRAADFLKGIGVESLKPIDQLTTGQALGLKTFLEERKGVLGDSSQTRNIMASSILAETEPALSQLRSILSEHPKATAAQPIPAVGLVSSRPNGPIETSNETDMQKLSEMQKRGLGEYKQVLQLENTATGVQGIRKNTFTAQPGKSVTPEAKKFADEYNALSETYTKNRLEEAKLREAVPKPKRIKV